MNKAEKIIIHLNSEIDVRVYKNVEYWLLQNSIQIKSNGDIYVIPFSNVKYITITPSNY